MKKLNENFKYFEEKRKELAKNLVIKLTYYWQKYKKQKEREMEKEVQMKREEKQRQRLIIIE